MEFNDQIVECVPNFSEGRNQKTIDAIANAIRQHDNVSLIDIDPGQSTNRTVYTIVGRPSDVIQSIVSAAKVAYEMIDMSKHHGEHKRLGAMDVCPFIPIKNLDMDGCVELAKICAAELYSALGIPCYLYGYAAKEDYRRTVPDIRQGEYEGLKEKIVDPAWKPDYGPDEWSPIVERWGASMVGARKVLIAYNINLMGTKEQANKIAFDIREQGRGPNEPGSLKAIQAMGWVLDEHKISQITMNLIDYEITSLIDVWLEVNRRAKEYCLPICGSEIVGLIPLKALLDVAEYFIKNENLLILEEEQKVQFAISKLGLNFLGNFKLREKIIEYILEDQSKKERLVDLSVKKFIDEVRSRNVVPGGGSVSALIGSLACSLTTMVCKISSGRKKFECNDNLMKQILPKFYKSADQFLKYVDLDSEAYSKLSEANRMPSSNLREQDIKQSTIRIAVLNAIDVPREMVKEALEIMKDLKVLCPIINMNAVSDLQVAIVCLKTAVYGGCFNVLLNVQDLTWNMNCKETLELKMLEYRNLADQLERELLELLTSKTEV